MSLSLYGLLKPSLMQALLVLLKLLDKAEAHFQADDRDLAELADLRLAPDMNPLPFQIEAAVNNALGAAARLQGLPAPRVEGLATVADMRRALTEALAELESLGPEAFEGAENHKIVLPSPKGARHFDGLDYVVRLVLPNVHFHTAIAYALLRTEGLDIGKRDFLGELPPRRAPD